MVSLALHEPYVHAGHIKNLSELQVPHPWIKLINFVLISQLAGSTRESVVSVSTTKFVMSQK